MLEYHPCRPTVKGQKKSRLSSIGLRACHKERFRGNRYFLER